MAPRDLPKATPKVQRSISKPNTVKKPTFLAAPVSAIKKTVPVRKTMEKTPVKVSATKTESRQRSNTVPKVGTPNPKENKSVPISCSITRSAKKSWKRRPKPAHSGVPVPEKMKRILERQLHDSDCSL